MAVNGWDERDYKLWSKVRCLPSYGLIAPNDRMISQKAVEELLRVQAKERYDKSK